MLSFLSLVTESAIAIDTARGIPSGIATINKQTHVIAILLAMIKVSDERRILCDFENDWISWFTDKKSTSKSIIEMAYFFIYLALVSSFYSSSVYCSLISS